MTNYLFDYSQYKKRITKKNYSFVGIILSIILLLGTIVFLRPKSPNLNELYFVEISNFQTYHQAKNLSDELLNQGCIAYNYFDKKYHILVSYHTKKSDAEKVASKLKNDYPSSNVFTLEHKNFIKKTNLNSKQNSSIENFIKQSKKTIILLEENLINFSTKEQTLAQTKTQIFNMQDDFNNAYETLITQFKKDTKYNIAKEYANTIFQSLSLVANLEENEFEINTRYQIINIAITLSKFENFF